MSSKGCGFKHLSQKAISKNPNVRDVITLKDNTLYKIWEDKSRYPGDKLVEIRKEEFNFYGEMRR